MENNMKWSQFVTDKKTGKNIIVFTTLINGISVSPEDLGDEDALREMNEF